MDTPILLPPASRRVALLPILALLVLGACQVQHQAHGRVTEAPHLKTIHVRTGSCGHYSHALGAEATRASQAR